MIPVAHASPEVADLLARANAVAAAPIAILVSSMEVGQAALMMGDVTAPALEMMIGLEMMMAAMTEAEVAAATP